MPWREVTPTSPCPICGKPDWCSVTDDGAWVVCRRADNGRGTHRVDRAGADFWLYRLVNGKSPTPDFPARQEEPERADPDTLDTVYTFILTALELKEEHYENLRRRGMPEGEIARRGYRTLPLNGRRKLAKQVVNAFGPEVCAKVPGLYIKDGEWSLSGPPGLLIPCRDVKGRIVALKVRADDPSHGKYLYISSKTHGGPGPGAVVHIPLWDGPVGDIVRVTEGELKADVATILSGVLTIAIPGVSCWQQAIPILKDLGIKKVLVAFDADWRINQHVKQALHRAIEALLTEGFEAWLEDWPLEKAKGIDDLLAEGEKPKLLKATVERKQTQKAASTLSEEGEWQPRIIWPDPPAPAAFYGLAGEFARLVEPYTEADPVALLAQFLIMFGNVIGRQAHFKVEADIHYLNEYLALVGTTSKGRKGTSLGWVRRLFATVDGEWAAKCIQSGLSSGEGLVWAIRDPIERKEAIYAEVDGKKEIIEWQTLIVDPGVDDKRLLVFEAEFASVLKVLDRQGNTLSAIIRDAWDTGNLQTLTKHNKAHATDGHISIIAHITKQELLRYLDSTEAGNGFGNRFIWICVRRSKLLPDGGSTENVDFNPLIQQLARAVEFGRYVGEIKRDAEATKLWREAYPRLSEGYPGLLGAILARAEAHVMRLACIYALLDLSPLVRAEHLQAALALWDYAERSARFIFGDALGNPIADEILQALRQAGEKGLSRTQIRDLFGRNVSAHKVRLALEELAAAGLATCQRQKAGNGRPSEKWYASTTMPGARASSEQAEEISGEDELPAPCDAETPDIDEEAGEI